MSLRIVAVPLAGVLVMGLAGNAIAQETFQAVAVSNAQADLRSAAHDARVAQDRADQAAARAARTKRAKDKQAALRLAADLRAEAVRLAGVARQAQVRTLLAEHPEIDRDPVAWTGAPIPHPGGGSIDAQTARWAAMTLDVMDELGIAQKYLPGILAQMQQESSGNPTAINHWDVNASNGIPSQGLMQVIPPTYRGFAKDGYESPQYLMVPYLNVYAALHYVQESYGEGKFRSWNAGHNQGY